MVLDEPLSIIPTSGEKILHQFCHEHVGDAVPVSVGCCCKTPVTEGLLLTRGHGHTVRSHLTDKGHDEVIAECCILFAMHEGETRVRSGNLHSGKVPAFLPMLYPNALSIISSVVLVSTSGNNPEMVSAILQRIAVTMIHCKSFFRLHQAWLSLHGSPVHT
jgi:hypothetical protein